MRFNASAHLFDVAGVPVHAHLSLPLGMLLVGQFQIRPLAWLGLVFVILVHELGHAFLLRRYRLPVIRVVLHGFGGECETAEWMTPWQHTVVAWGGVLAQGVLFGLVALAAALHLVPKVLVSSDFYFALTGANLLIAAFNLLPMGNLDGRYAWRILKFGYLRLKHRRLRDQLTRLEARREQEEATTDRRNLH